jgi:hypothetical protein
LELGKAGVGLVLLKIILRSSKASIGFIARTLDEGWLWVSSSLYICKNLRKSALRN